MSAETAISMFELEMESAERLPGRETLCAPRCGHSSSFSFSQANYQVGLVNVGLNIGSINL
jgi:hypothetical protein